MMKGASRRPIGALKRLEWVVDTFFTTGSHHVSPRLIFLFIP